MAKAYTSKYPSIIIDKVSNSVNDSLQKKMTIEEYYDIMHHTHNISDLAVKEGTMSISEMQTTINDLLADIGDLKSIIEAQKNTINELKENIEIIKEEISNVTTISDYDVETPGIQDAEGNTLGTLMGFTMTEIGEEN